MKSPEVIAPVGMGSPFPAIRSQVNTGASVLKEHHRKSRLSITAEGTAHTISTTNNQRSQEKRDARRKGIVIRISTTAYRTEIGNVYKTLMSQKTLRGIWEENAPTTALLPGRNTDI